MGKRASAKGKARGKDKGLPFQDPHASPSRRANLLEEAIGREVKGFREKLGLTIAELAKAADMSAACSPRSRTAPPRRRLPRCRPWARRCKCLSPRCSAVSRNPRRHLRESWAGPDHRAARHAGRPPVPAAGPQPARAGDGGALPHHAYPAVRRVPTFQHAGFEFLYMLEGNVVYGTATKHMTCIPAMPFFFDATRHMGRKICASCRRVTWP